MREISFSPLTALDVGPPHQIDFVADAGFALTGLRLHPATTGGPAYPLPLGSAALRETHNRLQARGVQVLDIEVLLIDAQTDVHAFLPCIEAGAALGASRLGVNGEDPELDRFTEKFARLCDLAKPYGMEVDLEFMVWRPIHNLQTAEKMVRAAGRDNGKILIDTLHLARSGGKLSDLQALDPKLIGLMQICDAPFAGPLPHETKAILAEARTGRLPPLEGELPLLDWMRAVPSSTPISVEVPMAASTRFTDVLKRVRHIRKAGERCLQMALLSEPKRH
jgi:sugar phosphate isomerase/epimerase